MVSSRKNLCEIDQVNVDLVKVDEKDFSIQLSDPLDNFILAKLQFNPANNTFFGSVDKMAISRIKRLDLDINFVFETLSKTLQKEMGAENDKQSLTLLPVNDNEIYNVTLKMDEKNLLLVLMEQKTVATVSNAEAMNKLGVFHAPHIQTQRYKDAQNRALAIAEGAYINDTDALVTVIKETLEFEKNHPEEAAEEYRQYSARRGGCSIQ